MSKSQIRKKNHDVRERIRLGVEALVFMYGEDLVGLSWLEDALRLSREAEAEGVTTIQETEKVYRSMMAAAEDRAYRRGRTDERARVLGLIDNANQIDQACGVDAVTTLRAWVAE